MKILIVSGFLGAGKTTFIKEMIRSSGKYLVILENEYGQNNLDSQDISRNGPADLKLLEFMEGCVCCTRKDTFSNTILTISAGIDPEYLVVEPTGVGKLSNIMAAIQKVSYEKIVMLKPVVVLAPRSFEENMAEFGEIYEDQLRHAGIIVFSKIEHEDPEVICRTAGRIREMNPSAEILMEHYTTRDKKWWDSLFMSEGEVPAEVREEETSSDLMEVSLQNAYLTRPAELILLLEDILRGEFGRITRAKGILRVGEEWLRFDVADRLYAIIQEPSETPSTQCFFAGRELDKNHLCDRLNSFEAVFGKPKLPRKRGRNYIKK